MSNERRYDDDEVAAIFESAATNPGAGRRAVTGDRGLTLRELTAIGREVGIAPERIEKAAAALDRRGVATDKGTFLGMPVAVGRTAALPRAPTDREWGILLSELRETFSARGTEKSGGGVRHWANGNLHAFIEPTETGYRLRMGTRKGDAALFNTFGITAVLIGLGNITGLLTSTLSGVPSGATMIAAGVAILAGNAFRLTRWSGTRAEQMARIAERANGLLGAASGPASPRPPA